MNVLMSVVGIVVLLLIAFLLSENRRAINLRTVGGAFAIQFLLGGLILYTPWGYRALQAVAQGVVGVINYGNKGKELLFGNLINFSVDGLGFIFVFQVLPVIVFFSSLVAVLYYLGIMQVVIKFIGGQLQKALHTSPAESLSATANIFVGQTEAPLVVRPFINNMTQSELFAVMTGGLASIAGSVMGGYISIGVKAEYVVAACFMAAPGGLLFAKIIKPETETPDGTIPTSLQAESEEKPSNVIDAAASGAASGAQLAFNVGAMLLAFVGLIALLNGILHGCAEYLSHYIPQIDPEMFRLENLLGYLFAPLAYLIGVPWEESSLAGSFIGQKLILNEFIAYNNFVPYVKEGASVVLTDKTQAIISFALCGFANFSSIAILLGGLGGLAPKRRSDIAKMGLSAVIAGTLSNLMSATIAGLFLSI